MRAGDDVTIRVGESRLPCNARIVYHDRDEDLFVVRFKNDALNHTLEGDYRGREFYGAALRAMVE
ncbi:MAG: hypothetical protein JXQ29_18685 [Planctomycetes bacterium]|nr:hypothetical protein [Planctomycetota bacterium]